MHSSARRVSRDHEHMDIIIHVMLALIVLACCAKTIYIYNIPHIYPMPRTAHFLHFNEIQKYIVIVF
jgi:hypothetical protein